MFKTIPSRIQPGRRSPQGGFTLIELLIVMGLLAVILAIVLVAINPAKQFADANNTQRQSDVNAILNAVTQYAAGNKGALPAGITTTAKTITSVAGATNIDLCAALVNTYIADLPIDPKVGTKTPANSVCTAATAYNTGYTILSPGGSRVTVSAPGAENSATISVTR
jgi:prepilin-type N-terminal cleavage/methylation domain-containing protein